MKPRMACRTSVAAASASCKPRTRRCMQSGAQDSSNPRAQRTGEPEEQRIVGLVLPRLHMQASKLEPELETHATLDQAAASM